LSPHGFGFYLKPEGAACEKKFQKFFGSFFQERTVFLKESSKKLLTVMTMLLPVPGLAQTVPPAPVIIAVPPPASAVQIKKITVLERTFLLGTGFEASTVAASSTVLDARDIERTGPPNALRALNQSAPGVNLDNAQGNDLAPNLLYHGFTASPLIGNSQGLAVYLDGVRFNEPFGDTVNWDLLPSIAINTINVEGSNPIFGLNALGGAVSVELKNGFSYHGGEATLDGGTTDRAEVNLQYGAARGNDAAYVALSGEYDHGWRQDSSAKLAQLYARFDHVGSKGAASLSIIGARDALNGPGTVPIQLFDAAPRAVFTSPNFTANQFGLVTAHLLDSLSDTRSLQATLYYETYQQRVRNGNTANVNTCPAGGTLCDGTTPLLTRDGTPIADYLNGGPYSQLNLQGVDTNSAGGSLQFGDTSRVLGHRNRLVAGISLDAGFTNFNANAELGGLSVGRGFVGPGLSFIDAAASIAPVHVGITDIATGLYVSDVFSLTRALSLNLGGRENIANIDLRDFQGGALNGTNSYRHFNPSIGVTWKHSRALTLYASASEANRTPNPAELSCSGPQSPCTLANFFVGDPPLKQVVARNFEAGLRGSAGAFGWSLDLFRSGLANDIIFVASTTPGLAYFQNAGATRRQGADIALTYHTPHLDLWASYSYTAATFQSPLMLSSPLNPAADAAGNILVRPGDRLPGVPAQIVKLGAEYRVTPRLTLGATGQAQSGAYLFGDESNQNPTTGSFFFVTLNAKYQLTEAISLFGSIDNAFNNRYFTYGTFGPTNAIPIAEAPGAANPRSLSPAAPIEAYGGVKWKF
jgi:iron complex outermembrane receptor protein